MATAQHFTCVLPCKARDHGCVSKHVKHSSTQRSGSILHGLSCLQDARGITPLGAAVGFNRLGAVKVLLKADANVAVPDARGNTALHYAAGMPRPASYVRQRYSTIASLLAFGCCAWGCLVSDEQGYVPAACEPEWCCE